ARRVGAVDHQARRSRERVVSIADDRRAALEVGQESGAPAVADLTGKETEAIDTGLIGTCRHSQVSAAALEARPVALRFDTEHPVCHLAAVADLATNRGASGICGALIRERRI